MNRIIEIAAMAIGGLSLFLVAFVGFASLSGRDMSQVAVIGKLFPKPAEKEGEHGEAAGAGEHADGPGEEHGRGLSDAAVVEASLGVLSAWTLPSPYSTTELRGLSEEIKKKRAELEEAEHALARRERAVQDDEAELAGRMETLGELQKHLEGLQVELAEREQAVVRREATLEAGADARWTAVAGVIAAIEEPAAAAKRLAEYEPEEAAKILRALNDDERAGAILNAFDEARWKEYVGAYTAEKARAGGKGKRK
jgi:flagellar motility protein MotE (MotC chaperone)